LKKLLLMLVASIFVYSAQAQQTVFLDFDSHTDVGEHVYTVGERDAILAAIAVDFALFDYAFTLTAPVSGDYSILFFNRGDPGIYFYQDIDFRNLDPNDEADINVNVLATTSAEFVSYSATVGARMLGHLGGLRHGDSFGPIGMGISSTGLPDAADYSPIYPGPAGADEINDHIMATEDSVGANPGHDSTAVPFFSERSAVKLAFNESGTVYAEAAGAKDTQGTAQPVALYPLAVPNTLMSGDHDGAIFKVSAFAVTGSIDVSGESDYYSFIGRAGDVLNVEVLSEILGLRNSNSMDSKVSIYNSGGNLVDYYTGKAENDDEFETTLSFDSIIIDLILPADDTYYIKVEEALFNTGDYELFAYKFATAFPADSDGDGTADIIDNCSTLSNPSQRNTDGDEYGNRCDPDLNNDGLVTVTDFLILRGRLNSNDPDADFNGDGFVTVTDFLILRGFLNQSPGPGVGVPDWTLELFNTDDTVRATLGGEEILTCGSGATCEIDFGTLLQPGNNALRIEVTNDSGVWSYGYKVTRDGSVFSTQICGTFGVMGCQNNDATLGIVLDRLVTIPLP